MGFGNMMRGVFRGRGVWRRYGRSGMGGGSFRRLKCLRLSLRGLDFIGMVNWNFVGTAIHCREIMVLELDQCE